MSVIITSIQFASRQWRLVLMVYFIQLALAGIFGLLAFDLIDEGLGNSLELKKLLLAYDHTVICDMIQEYSKNISTILLKLPWIVVIWLGISTLLNTGLLVATEHLNLVSVKEFFLNALKVYFAFLKITLIFVFMMLIVIGVILVPVLIKLEYLFTYFDSEKYGLFILFASLIIVGALLAFLFIWSVLSKLASYSKKRSTFSAIHQGFRTIQHKASHIFSLFCIVVLLQLILFGIFCLLEQSVPAVNGFGISLLFVVQQIDISIRILSRLVLYFGLSRM